MQVILLERVEKLGQMGDVVNVKPGYARNYLLPKNKALRATKEALARFQSQRVQLEADNLKRREEAQAVAGRMHGLAVTIVRQAGDTGQLYGSVNARDIAQRVTAAGVTVDRAQVVIDQPIKNLGLYPVRVRLHPEVSVEVMVNVARSAEEAKLQAAGVAVGAVEAEMFEPGAGPAAEAPEEPA